MEPLLLLHGALRNSHQFDNLTPKLEHHFEIHSLNFEGHGNAGPTNNPFRIEYFVENVLGYLDEYSIASANIFGYSMGGYVALTLAKEYSTRIKKIATLGTILEWNEEKVKRECRWLHPNKMREKVPDFVDRLESQHIEGWERVVNRTREMLEHLGKHQDISADDWKSFRFPIRLHVGDRDTTAGVEETYKVYKDLPQADFCVLPDSPHPFEEINVSMLVSSLLTFY